jgi:DNA-binding NarL/FixJ family response regulator
VTERWPAPESAEPADGTGDIGVLVVDDHAVVRRGLTAYLESAAGIEVVAEAVDGKDALDQLQRLATEGRLPEVVLMDVLMPRMDGIAAIRAVLAAHPGVRVVVLTSFGELERVHAALEAGAAGYLLKDADPDEVAAAIRSADRGEVHLDPTVAGRLTRRLVSPPTGLAALTARERSILALVARGMSNHQIAAELYISERTARTHVSHILAKLQLSSRTQAALVAIREGLVSPPGP